MGMPKGDNNTKKLKTTKGKKKGSKEKSKSTTHPTQKIRSYSQAPQPTQE